jgi:hypothetical protein
MNRHKRRKAAKVMEIRLVSAAELATYGSVCIWDGCDANFHGVMPLGWQWIIRYHAPKPELHTWTPEDWAEKQYQDACLCPEHARSIDTQFKDLTGPRELLNAAPGGRA